MNKLTKKSNVVFKSKNNVFIDKRVKFGDNVIVYENVRIEGESEIGDNVTIFPNCYIDSSIIGKGTKIYSSHIEKSKIGARASIGPFAHLRINSNVGDSVKVGNFCELKNCEIGSGTKISHLAYVGDATVGKKCNIGCGVIFVNYNGKTKSRTIIGDNVFIGSNVNLVAPVKIENDSYICAGTTIDKDVASGDFVIGRVRQEVKPGRASKYLKSNTDENLVDTKS